MPYARNRRLIKLRRSLYRCRVCHIKSPRSTMLFSPKDCTTIWPDPSRCLEPLPPISNSSALVQIGSRPPVATLSGEETFGQSRVDTPARPWGPFIFRLVGALTFKFSVPGNPKATNRFQLAMDTDTGEAKHALVAKYERDFFGLTWEGNAGLNDDVVKHFRKERSNRLSPKRSQVRSSGPTICGVIVFSSKAN